MSSSRTLVTSITSARRRWRRRHFGGGGQVVGGHRTAAAGRSWRAAARRPRPCRAAAPPSGCSPPAGEQAGGVALAQRQVGHHQRGVECTWSKCDRPPSLASMRRPVSSISSSCWFFSSWYSREISLRARAVAFQSSWRRLSPMRYSRIWWKSVPSPRRRLTMRTDQPRGLVGTEQREAGERGEVGIDAHGPAPAAAVRSCRHRRHGARRRRCTPSKAVRAALQRRAGDSARLEATSRPAACNALRQALPAASSPGTRSNTCTVIDGPAAGAACAGLACARSTFNASDSGRSRCTCRRGTARACRSRSISASSAMAMAAVTCPGSSRGSQAKRPARQAAQGSQPSSSASSSGAWPHLARRFHLGQQRGAAHRRRLAFDLQLRRQRDAMTQRGARDFTHIVRGHEVAAGQHRLRARRTHQRDAAARAGAERDARPAARRRDDAHRVVDHFVIDG
jgi:hypothetical protein